MEAKNKRQWQDLNLRAKIAVDFESTPLTARAHCQRLNQATAWPLYPFACASYLCPANIASSSTYVTL